MSERRSFIRKITYALAALVLLVPISMLSMPATATRQGIDPGGKLAQLRDEYNLGQADIGLIDPASETMKLATLGLRGVAMNLLWEKARHYKMTEDWSNLTATLEQLARLQPNFLIFWRFQSWNLSYNVSVEFDDYRDRYYYVRRGIQFLKQGERYNQDNPHLLWDLGWFIGQKIGRADEHVQYRRLFKADDDYHPEDRPPERRDNWLVGKEWYLKGVDAVDNRGRSFGKKSPKIFYSSPAMSQINYSEAIEKEGFFDKARRGWIRAAEEWAAFGRRVIEHSTGVKLRLGDEPRLEELVAELTEQLDNLVPGTRQALVAERRAALTDEQREAFDKPPRERSNKEYELAIEAERRLEVTDRDVAERISEQSPEDKNEALKLASELQRVNRELRYTINYKRDSNYDYWETRCAFEQTPDALKARELMYVGRRSFEDDADLITAKDRYDQGFAAWRRVIDAFPTILDDQATTGDDLMEYVKEYREILNQLDESIPDDFPLWEVIVKFDTDRLFTEEISEYQRRQGISTDAPETPSSDTSSEAEKNGEAGSDEEPTTDESVNEETT